MGIKSSHHKLLIVCLFLLPGLGCDGKVDTFETGLYEREYLEGRNAYEVVELKEGNVYTQKFYENGQLRFSNSGYWEYISKYKDPAPWWDDKASLIVFVNWLSADELLRRERLDASTDIKYLREDSISAGVYEVGTFSFGFEAEKYKKSLLGDYWPANNLIVSGGVNSKKYVYDGHGYSADMDKLIQTLSSRQIVHHVTRDKDEIVVTIGQEGEYIVRNKIDWMTFKWVIVQTNYEQPVYKEIVQQWLKQCGTDVDDDFYKPHTSLSPSVIKDIQTRWQLDLTNVSVAPTKFGKQVLVFVSSNITAARLAEKLKSIPRRTLQKGEFIKSDEFEVKGDDLDTVVYGWTGKDGSRLFVAVATSLDKTMLSLWAIPPGAPVAVNLGELSGDEAFTKK